MAPCLRKSFSRAERNPTLLTAQKLLNQSGGWTEFNVTIKGKNISAQEVRTENEQSLILEQAA